ncbi:MAG: glycoside hydrolase family 3 protein [Leptospiraceae bacterium]|nr:glycoside hydrolase family 3 protein [Leptospiraceae bacterium]
MAFFYISSIGLFIFTLQLKSPLFFKIRGFDLILSLPGSFFLCFLLLKKFKNNSNPSLFYKAIPLFILLNATTFFLGLYSEIKFTYYRYIVEHTNPEIVQKYAKHILLGYSSEEVIEEHIRKGRLGGVFISQRNVEGKNTTDLQKLFSKWKSEYCKSGAGSLILAADQEGGIVSRLSPPLEDIPNPGMVYKTGGKEALAKYAAKKAKDIKNLGLNMNLSPVVDLEERPKETRMDLHTQIWLRAISSDQEVVSEVATMYAGILRKDGIYPVLKHFPGLARIKKDTHFFTAELDESKEILQKTDWLPFIQIPKTVDTGIMIGFIIVNTLDSELAAPFSHKVMDYIRQENGFQGLLLTDDYSMGPAFYHKKDISELASLSLSAGIDLILVTYDPRLYYPLLYGLIQKEKNGKGLNLNKSKTRLEKVFPKGKCNNPESHSNHGVYRHLSQSHPTYVSKCSMKN